MKKNIHLPLYKIKFHCISCFQEYQTFSTSASDIKIQSCSNCVYPGASISEVKMGAVEKFRQRSQKTKTKN